MRNKFLLLFTMISVALFSQVDNPIAGIEDKLTDLSKDLAGPATSSATTGLSWSDAHIGQFPHFGAGIFLSSVFIPVDGINNLLEVAGEAGGETGVKLPSELTQIPMGIPLPSFGLDGRIGGFGIPFDIGVKFSYVNSDLEGIGNIDYMLIGGDFRYALLEEGALIPALSVGLGFSRLTNSVTLTGLLGKDIELVDPTYGGGLYLDDPDLTLGWEANVIEGKLQVSKQLLAITPYFGVNVSYGFTTVNGGLKTAVKDGAGNKLTQQQVDDTIELARTAGADVPDIDSSGFTVSKDLEAMGLKLTLGTSFNLFMVRIDLSGNYDVMNELLGTQLGFRIQL